MKAKVNIKATVGGKRVAIAAGDPIPDGIAQADLEYLKKVGAVEQDALADKPAATESAQAQAAADKAAADKAAADKAAAAKAAAGKTSSKK